MCLSRPWVKKCTKEKEREREEEWTHKVINFKCMRTQTMSKNAWNNYVLNATKTLFLLIFIWIVCLFFSFFLLLSDLKLPDGYEILAHFGWQGWVIGEINFHVFKFAFYYWILIERVLPKNSFVSGYHVLRVIQVMWDSNKKQKKRRWYLSVIYYVTLLINFMF